MKALRAPNGPGKGPPEHWPVGTRVQRVDCDWTGVIAIKAPVMYVIDLDHHPDAGVHEISRDAAHRLYFRSLDQRPPELLGS
jgi:hypothetical protein